MPTVCFLSEQAPVLYSMFVKNLSYLRYCCKQVLRDGCRWDGSHYFGQQDLSFNMVKSKLLL